MEYSKKTTISWYLIFISVITSLPLLFITGIVLKYSVNMPWQDDWTLFVPGIEDVFTGNISFKTLWVLEQDHKTFFFNIVAFAIIYFSKWQSFYFGLASILCNLIVFIILSLWIKRLLDFYKQRKLFYFAFPILSIILFSASYGINWVFNTILIIFITNAAVISLFYFLIQEKFRWKNFVIASFMGMIAALSYASGLFSLYMGFLILLYYRLRQKHEKNLPIILWALLTILLTCSYFIGYKPIEAHPSAFAFLSNVKYHLHFFFSLVGYPVILSPYVTPHIITKAIGCFGIIWFFSITFLVIKENKNNFEVLLPFFVLGIYSIISGLMITAGRAELGMDFSYRDRYTLITNFLWISNIVFTAFYFVKLHEKYRFFIKSLTIVFCFIMIATLGIKYIFGLYYMQEFSYKLSMATKGILEGKTTPETNEYLRGYMPLKLELLPILKKYNVSLYREQK